LKFSTGTRTEDWAYHLGGDIYASVSKQYPQLDLRRFFRVDNKKSTPLPTRKGITLRAYQLDKLISLESNLEAHYPPLKDYVPCFMRPDHDSESLYMKCIECCPALNEDSA
jgi:hypothetical protein